MDSRGFSILEIMIVVSIIGIAGSMVTASISQSTRVAGAQFEAEKVRDGLVRARNLARFQLKCVTVDVQPDRINITPYNTCSPFLAGPDPTETILFEPTITLAPFDTGNPLTFNTMGGTVVAAPSTMVATTSTGKTYRYLVMPAIGSLSMR